MSDSTGRVRVKSLMRMRLEKDFETNTWLRNEKYCTILTGEKIQGFVTQTLTTGVTRSFGTHNFQLSFHSGPFIIL